MSTAFFSVFLSDLDLAPRVRDSIVSITGRLRLLRGLSALFSSVAMLKGTLRKSTLAIISLTQRNTTTKKKKVLSLELSCCFQVRDVIFPWTTRIIASFFPLCFASGLNVTLSFDSFVWFFVPASCASNVFFPCSLFSVTCNQGNRCPLKAFW